MTTQASGINSVILFLK